MKKNIIILFLALLILGCATTNTDIIEKGGNSFIAMYIGEYDHVFSFLNLDTDEIVKIKMKEISGLDLAEIPPGRYALVKIFGGKLLGKTYRTDVPYELMTVITISENSVTYLGDLNYRVASKAFSLSDGEVTYSYSYDRFLNEIKLIDKKNLSYNNIELMPKID